LAKTAKSSAISVTRYPPPIVQGWIRQLAEERECRAHERLPYRLPGSGMIYFSERDTEQEKIRRLRKELRWAQFMRKYSRESEPSRATHMWAFATGTPRRAKESIQHWKARIRAAEIAFPGWGGGPPAIYAADDPLVEQELEELERADADRFQACEECGHGFWQSRKGEKGGKSVCDDCEEAVRARRSRKNPARQAKLAMGEGQTSGPAKRGLRNFGGGGF